MHYQNFTRFLAIGLATAISVSSASAQEVEEEPVVEAPPGFVLPPRLRQIAFRDGNPWTFQVNARMNNGAATVDFAGLGGIDSIRNVPGANILDQPTREYDDGFVSLDQARADEKDANGNVFSTPGSRYVGLVNGVSQGDYLAYTPGQTRTWAILGEEQKLANGIAMNTYATSSNGSTLVGSEDSGALGMEMAVSRRIFKLSEKTEISLAASVGLNDIKSGATGRIAANLITMTDIYEVLGTLPVGVLQGPTAEDLFNSDGAVILASGLETTVPLQQITANRSYSTVIDGAQVDGTWAIKGAYYSFRIGTQIRSHLTEKFAVSAGVGVVGAYVGTDFAVTEILDTTGFNTISGIQASADVNHSEMIIGFYGDIAMEYWFTPRTAFFAGVAFEGLDSYVQVVGGRTAAIDLGQNLVLRFGITTRF